MEDWDPELYNRFRRYRAEPVDLIFARVEVARDARIIDLGCGTGENTAELALRAPAGFALGIDASPAMIARAERMREGLTEDLRARLRFDLQDMREFAADGLYDLVFSNAAIQWLTDHRRVFARCFAALAPGGRLAVQMPANDHEMAQATMRQLAGEPSWRPLIGDVESVSRTGGAPEAYRAMLAALGFAGVDCHYHTFHHPMSGAAEVVEWSRATALRPFLDRLDKDGASRFVTELTERLKRSYGPARPLVFHFRRLFIFARRPAA